MSHVSPCQKRFQYFPKREQFCDLHVLSRFLDAGLLRCHLPGCSPWVAEARLRHTSWQPRRRLIHLDSFAFVRKWVLTRADRYFMVFLSILGLLEPQWSTPKLDFLLTKTDAARNRIPHHFLNGGRCSGHRPWTGEKMVGSADPGSGPCGGMPKIWPLLEQSSLLGLMFVISTSVGSLVQRFGIQFELDKMQPRIDKVNPASSNSFFGHVSLFHALPSRMPLH